MKNFSKDTFTCEPMDQNLYFAQNLPKRNSKSDGKSDRSMNRKELGEFKFLVLVLRWILLVLIYPFHFVFQVVPLFIEKRGIVLYKKIAIFAEKTKYYFLIIWIPLVRVLKKAFNIVIIPFKAAYVLLSNWMQRHKERIYSVFKKSIDIVKKVNSYLQALLNNAFDAIINISITYHNRIKNIIVEIRQRLAA